MAVLLESGTTFSPFSVDTVVESQKMVERQENLNSTRKTTTELVNYNFDLYIKLKTIYHNMTVNAGLSSTVLGV